MMILPATIMAIECDDDRTYMTDIYLQHRLLMLKVAWNYVHNRDDVMDIVSESCTALIDHFSKIRAMERSELRAYIVITVKNTALNFRAKKLWEQTMTLDSEEAADILRESGMVVLPDDRIILNDELQHISKAIQHLSERERFVLSCRIMEGQSFESIAETLHTTPSNARKILERAREHIKTSVYGRKGI